MHNNDPIIPPTAPLPQPINGQPSGLPIKRKNWLMAKKYRLWTLLAIIFVIIIAMLGTLIWFRIQLSSVNNNKSQLVQVTIISGMNPDAIGSLLQKDGIIRSSVVFDVYTRITNNRGKLQAGGYRLSPSDTTPEIIDHLVNGKVDKFSITFLPGATLAEDRSVLINAGFSTNEVDSALSAPYSLALFNTKPSTADLEGYIYGDTYDFNSGATVTDILMRTFTEYESVIQTNNLVSGFAKHGLSLYQGITLASIIQREVSGSSDQKQVAQIFYKRLSMNISLGSDVTFIYAAKKLGVPASPTLDSPYNTRINVGLPPGPIAVPGLGALQAVANPSSGDYLYFLSGDDGKTYFATTNAEHESNITNYCKVKCSQ